MLAVIKELERLEMSAALLRGNRVYELLGGLVHERGPAAPAATRLRRKWRALIDAASPGLEAGLTPAKCARVSVAVSRLGGK